MRLHPVRPGSAGSAALLGLLLWAGACSSALAQKQVAQLLPAQSLSCIQRPERPPILPQGRGSRASQGTGFVRVMMHFQAPDQAPRIELMVNTACEAMQDQVFSYLSWYRLPCVQPADGVVKAVQEFSFRAPPDEASPVPSEPGPEADSKFCLVMPRSRLWVWSAGNQLSHELVEGRFAAGGASEPELKVRYSNAPSAAAKAALAHLAQYRMPCREDGDKAYVFEQQLTFLPETSARPLALEALLDMFESRQCLDAAFSLGSMFCPFTLFCQVRQPALPNAVTQDGKSEASRLPLIKWLQAQRLEITESALLNEMFGTQLEIKVGCGQLDLRPSSAAEQVAVPAAQAEFSWAGKPFTAGHIRASKRRLHSAEA